MLDTNALIKAAVAGTVFIVIMTILSRIPCLGGLFSLLSLLGYILSGAAYGHFAKENDAAQKIEVYHTALYGGLAAALASIIPTLFARGGQDHFFLIQSMFIGIALCFRFVIAFVLGAIGGSVYGALVD